MTWWISARTLDGRPDWLADWIEADTFDEAREKLRARARQKWPDRAWSETSVTEQPPEPSGPVAYMLDLTAARRVA